MVELGKSVLKIKMCRPTLLLTVFLSSGISRLMNFIFYFKIYYCELKMARDDED